MNPLFLLLPVFVPVAGGFLILLLRFQDDRKRNIYSELIALLTSVLVWIALLAVRRDPLEIYHFTEDFSIAFRTDGLGSLFAGMVSLMWPVVMQYAFVYMKETKRKNMFFAFYIMTFGVTNGIAFAANLTTLYVFFEMLTLVTIPLVFYYQDHESLYAARKYALYTIGGAALAFFSVIMAAVYGKGGPFVYGGSMDTTVDPVLMRVVFLFGFFGFGTKAAVFPLNGWLPTASAAPTPVTALLHAVAVVNSGVFAIMRLSWYVFSPDFLLGTQGQRIALCVCIFTIVYAAALAVKERHFKRRLAESTVSNLSYMLFGVLLMTPEGFTAGMLHMVFHSLMKMLLFLCAGAFMHVTGGAYVYETNGIGRKMPATFGMYTVGALALTGIPLFCGFVSKWFLVMAGLHAGTKLAVAGVTALITAAFLCAIYTLSVSIRAFFPVKGHEWKGAQEGHGEAERGMLVPKLIFTVLNVVFGIWFQPLLHYLQKIASGQI